MNLDVYNYIIYVKPITLATLSRISSPRWAWALIIKYPNKKCHSNTAVSKLQKTVFSHWSRAGLLLDHPGVRLVVRHHAENGPIHREMVVDCPLVITSKVKLFFRPDKTRKKE